MYEIYQRLLDENGLKNADVARATGISNMTLSDWKRGKSVPKADKMQNSRVPQCIRRLSYDWKGCGIYSRND